MCFVLALVISQGFSCKTSKLQQGQLLFKYWTFNSSVLQSLLYYYRKSAAATPQDVERALERQRRMYEAKMTKLLQETRQIGTTASAPPIGPLNNLLPSSNSVTTFGATKTVATSSTSSLSSGQPMIQHTFTTANSTAVKNAAPLNPLGSQHPGSTVGCPPQLASSVK